MRVLITGGSGFIGSHIAEYHLAKDHDVYVVDDLSTGRLENIASFEKEPKFTFEKADITTWKNLDKAVSWADRIYHMAAVIGVFKVLEQPIKAITSNIKGCEILLEAVSKLQTHPRVIIASSSSVYGQATKEFSNEEDYLHIGMTKHPLAGYAVSKITNELLSLAYYSNKQIPLTIVRIFNTMGPRQTNKYGMVVPNFIQQACRGDTITVFGDGKQTRSFCDVRDVVVALNELASAELTIGEIVNVGQNQEIAIGNLALLIRERAKSLSEIQNIPYQQAYGMELQDIKTRKPDLGKLIKFTGFKHQWELKKTIDDLIARFSNKI
jgi:UDP-glucose 4-epimerase